MQALDLQTQIIRNLFFQNDLTNHYGLQMVLEFDAGCLYFDSSKLTYQQSKKILSRQLWKKRLWQKIPHPELDNNLTITAIKEDEATNYFIQFSNESILYIYQEIVGDGFWRQQFEIVDKTNPRYADVLEHMNEDWIENTVIHLEN